MHRLYDHGAEGENDWRWSWMLPQGQWTGPAMQQTVVENWMIHRVKYLTVLVLTQRWRGRGVMMVVARS